jgi:hypothetical protein
MLPWYYNSKCFLKTSQWLCNNVEFVKIAYGEKAWNAITME